MRSFHFPLERRGAAKELERAETRFEQQAVELAGIDRQRAEAESAEPRIEIEVRPWRPVSPGGRTAPGVFPVASPKPDDAMRTHRAECEKELLARPSAMLEAS
ncbi:MAG TPA: hypothetical protein VKB88_04600 [Bryobacteraceae bacterium]|nr:hypothetical protein [Bryobacteraceae bacterium]